MSLAKIAALVLLASLATAVPMGPPLWDEPCECSLGCELKKTLPSLRTLATEQSEWTQGRIETFLPGLLAENGVDVWVMSQLEYAEDPVFFSLAPPTQFSARRRTITVFSRSPFERRDFVGLNQGELEEAGDYVASLNPSTIALNVDRYFAFSDGLNAGELTNLEEVLDMSKVVHRPLLALDFMSLRYDGMLPRYKEIMQVVHRIIEGAFATAIVPGVTTTQDVQWWFADQAQDLGVPNWFFPSFDLSRRNSTQNSGVIERGDILWMDFGIMFGRMATDTQHMGYVLREGESQPPAGIAAGLKKSNMMQDILLKNMVVGMTGNEILAAALDEVAENDIVGTIYTHPIGDRGHGPGTTIGLWDIQDGVPVRGDVVLKASTWHSIELEASVPIPEWDNQIVSFRQEEEAYIDSEGHVDWVYQRQASLHLVH